uniref:FGFR1 oncogene partner 2 homolog isoform X1 n=1 Tax=Styela clava TaxID=7725 RepID=UPI00193A66A9|nr:FGFR1 oncogene partner 2 homolog isoform X1 [Styela clava]
MEARNTCQENLIELNKVAGHRPRSTLVLGIQQENNAIRSLQHENDELRQSLTEHQNALELIMAKYRQQMMKFTKHQNIQITENAYQAEKQYQEENMELIDKDHDSAAESLAEQASTLKKEMEARNTYQENLIELNKVAGHRPRSTLVLDIQQKNNAIRSLQHENDELRQSLTDHQNALELIMTKYRQQMMKFTKHQNIQITENAYQAEKQYQEENMELIDKDHDSAAESLVEQASTLKKEMEARNTHQENLIELNKVAGHRPRSTLVLGIQQENNAIRYLQHENDKLRQSLTEHQNALELIMTKYRQQMMKFTKHQKSLKTLIKQKNNIIKRIWNSLIRSTRWLL